MHCTTALYGPCQLESNSRRRMSLVTSMSCLRAVGAVGSMPSRGVAQLGSASALGAEGRRFKSCHPDQHDRYDHDRPQAT